MNRGVKAHLRVVSKEYSRTITASMEKYSHKDHFTEKNEIQSSRSTAIFDHDFAIFVTLTVGV